MSDILRSNLNHLHQQFYRQTTAPDALRTLRFARAKRLEFRERDIISSLPGSEYDMSRLLRDHIFEAVRDTREVQLRAAFDALLAYYSLVELASMVRYVPVPLPEEFRNEALDVLEDPDVTRYYERHYPLLLLRMFRQRLQGKLDVHDQSSTTVTPRFMEFLDVNALIERDPDVDTFLWFLDDGLLNRISLSDTLHALADPEELIERLCREEQERDPLDRSVHGFREFLIFCLEFYELLERTREFPLLQSGFWHYHSYWFDYLGRKVGKDLENALAQFAAWQVDPQSEEVSEASRHSLEHMRDVVSHLTSGEYGVALRHAIS